MMKVHNIKSVLQMKKLAAIIALAIWAATAGAQVLWKVSGNGLEKPSYILGTHHAAPHGLTDSIEGFAQAFQSCTQVYGEVMFDSLMMPQVATAMAQEMMCPPDSTISKLLTAKQYARLDSALKTSLGVGAQQLEMFKPAAISAQLAMALAMKEFPDMQQQEQLDMTIQSKAKENGKKLGALETVMFQTELLYGTPISQQAKELAEGLDQIEKLPEITWQMAEAYRKQDIDKLLEVIKMESHDSPEYLERILYSRNRNWAAQLKNIMAAAPTFFAVGAGHLPGDKGLLALLKEAGYKVEPVK